MKNDMPETVQQAVRYLIQTAAEAGVVVAGFAFSAEPMAITSFGNCTDRIDIRLYESLCSLAKQKQSEGLVIVETVGRPV